MLQCCFGFSFKFHNLICNIKMVENVSFCLLLGVVAMIMVDFLLKKATSDVESGVITHPRRSRRYPAKRLNDLDFADDIALLESTMSHARARLAGTATAAKDLGLIISVPGTECMTAGCSPRPSLRVCGGDIGHVSDFECLGSQVASSTCDFKRRKSLAWGAFWKLEHLWRGPSLSVSTKVGLFGATCVTVLLCGCGSWVVSQDVEGKMGAFATSCCGIMLGIRRRDRVASCSMCSMAGSGPLVCCVRGRRLRFLGRVLRLPGEEPARGCALCFPSRGGGGGDLGVLVQPTYLILIMCWGMINTRCRLTGLPHLPKIEVPGEIL